MRAIIIDDALALPKFEDLQKTSSAFREFATDHEDFRNWLQDTLGLKGDFRTDGFWNPLFDDERALRAFWERRRKDIPLSEELLTRVFGELETAVLTLQQPVLAAERELQARGYRVEKFVDLPEHTDEIGVATEVIVLDYLLYTKDGENPASNAKRSGEWLRKVVAASKSATGSPFVVLISSVPGQAEKAALELRQHAGLKEAFFRFVAKTSDAEFADFRHRLKSFTEQRETLKTYINFHHAQFDHLKRSCEQLIKDVDALELADLATLQIGQLESEGEGLGDYLNWLCAQVLHASLASGDGPNTAQRALPQMPAQALVGHIGPTNKIPNLFSAASLFLPAANASASKPRREIEVRFGDVFLQPASETVPDRGAGNFIHRDAHRERLVPRLRSAYAMGQGSMRRHANSKISERYAALRRPVPEMTSGAVLLVISQTCDLVQCKIDRVLCLEGRISKLQDNPLARFQATLRQMSDKKTVLISYRGSTWEMSISSKKVQTVGLSTLKAHKDYQYIGRLNELYALEAQRDYLDDIGRIGVPIRPAYQMYSTSLHVRVVGAKPPFVDDSSDDKLIEQVVCVLRPVRAHNETTQHLTIAHEAKAWFVDRLSRIGAAPGFPKALAAPLAALAGIGQCAALSLHVSPKGTVTFKSTNDAGDVDSKGIPGSCQIKFNGEILGKQGTPTAVYLEISFAGTVTAERK